MPSGLLEPETEAALSMFLVFPGDILDSVAAIPDDAGCVYPTYPTEGHSRDPRTFLLSRIKRKHSKTKGKRETLRATSRKQPSAGVPSSL